MMEMHEGEGAQWPWEGEDGGTRRRNWPSIEAGCIFL